MSEETIIDYHRQKNVNRLYALFVVSNPIPIKYALNHLGFAVGKPRLPLTEPDAKSEAHIETTIKGYRLDLSLVLRD